MIEQVVGDTVFFFMVFFSQSTVSSNRVMDNGSSCSVGSSIRVRRIYQWLYCVPLCSVGVPL